MSEYPLFDEKHNTKTAREKIRVEIEKHGRNPREATLHWIEENPEAFTMLESAFIRILSGRKRYSFKTILEEYRWDLRSRGYDADTFKINNNFSPYLARILLERHPEFKDKIELRKVRF